jgi:hypothetical protein
MTSPGTNCCCGVGEAEETQRFGNRNVAMTSSVHKQIDIAIFRIMLSLFLSPFLIA